MVVFRGGKAFYLPKTLGASYADFLLHRPNRVYPAFEVEVALQAEKAQVRAVNSIQGGSDARACREYRQALERLRRERKEAQKAGDREESERLAEEIQALEAALKGGRASQDTGERARSNVRHAITALRTQLAKREPEARAFGEHLKSDLILGYDCYYRQTEGEWE